MRSAQNKSRAFEGQDHDVMKIVQLVYLLAFCGNIVILYVIAALIDICLTK